MVLRRVPQVLNTSYSHLQLDPTMTQAEINEKLEDWVPILENPSNPLHGVARISFGKEFSSTHLKSKFVRVYIKMVRRRTILPDMQVTQI